MKLTTLDKLALIKAIFDNNMDKTMEYIKNKENEGYGVFYDYDLILEGLTKIIKHVNKDA